MAFTIPMKEGERSLDVFQIVGKLVLHGKEQFGKDVNEAKTMGTNLATGIGKALSTAAKVGAVAVGACATAVSAMTKASLDSFAQYEQLVGGSQLLFGDAYAEVAKNAKNAYKEVQMSQNDYLQQVNGFATGLKTALGGNEQAAAELAHKIIKAEADVVAATGNSQEAVQNAFNGIMKSNFTMLDNLQLGITPTKEGFQTLINEVNAYNSTLGKTTNYQISNLADCQAALVDYIAMKGLADYATLEAAGTIQGSLAMTKAAWQNFLTGFADSSQDLDLLLDNLVESATNSAKLIVPKIAQILGGISTAMGQIMPVIAAELPGLLEQLLPGVISGAVALVNGLIMALPSILQILIEQLPSVISQIADGLAACFPVLLATIEELFGQVWVYFEDIVRYAGETFQPIFGDLSAAFTVAKESLQPYIDALVEYVTSGELATDASNLLKDAVDFIAEAYQSAKDLINDTVGAFQDACTWVEEHTLGLELLASAIGVVTTAIVAFNIAQAIAKAGGIAMIALNASTTVGYYALVAAETVATAATSAFGAVMAFITSPITLVVAAIAAVIAVIVLCVKHWDEIKVKAAEVAAFMAEKWEDMKAVFKDAVAVGGKIIDDIKQGINNAWEGLKSWFSGLWDGLFGKLTANVNVNASSGETDGSHASGLDYVPFDGYIAELHRGEMVVPANEARMLRNGHYSSAQDDRMVELLGAMVEINQEMLQALLAGKTFKVGEREFARLVKQYA